MKLAGKLLMFWVAAVALGGGYAGVSILGDGGVSDVQVVALR